MMHIYAAELTSAPHICVKLTPTLKLQVIPISSQGDTLLESVVDMKKKFNFHLISFNCKSWKFERVIKNKPPRTFILEDSFLFYYSIWMINIFPGDVLH